MKRLSVVGGICASFLLGAAVTAVAQDEHQNDKQENAHPENRQEQARPQQQARPQEQARPDDRKNQQPQSGDRHEMTPQSEGRQEPQSGDRHPQKPENDRQMQQQQQGRDQERHEQARPEEKQGEHARAERHEESHRRIPDADFHAHFGHEHHFRPGRVQVYGGRPQFTYSGFVFELVEPWPTAWAYDDDDYYIDYVNDEYWLYSLRYPGVRLELIIIQ